MKSEAFRMHSLYRRNLATYLVLLLGIIQAFFAFTSNSGHAYQYPTTVKRNVQTKIYIPVSQPKKSSLLFSKVKTSNLVIGNGAMQTQNSSSYSYDSNCFNSGSPGLSSVQQETITVRIVTGQGTVGANNFHSDVSSMSVPNTFTLIADNTPTGTLGATANYVVSTLDCPTFQFTADAPNNYALDHVVVDSKTANTTIYSGIYTYSPVSHGTHSLDIYFKKVVYVVTWNPNNATTFTNNGAETYTVGQAINVFPNPAPAKDGFNFGGWTVGGGSDTYTVTYTPAIDGPVDFVAQWIPKSFNVSFDSNGGSPSTISDKTWTYGTLLTLPTAPIKAGYDFAGWYDTATAGTKITDPATISYTPANTQDFTLYAHWTAHEYTVSFNSNGGTPSTISDKPWTYGTLLTLPTAPIKEGYDFAGWYDSAINGNRVVAASTTSYIPSNTENFTLHAHWAPKTLNITYMTGGGRITSAGDATTTTEGTISNLPTVTYECHNFNGWFTDPSDGTKIDTSHPHGKIADFTLYAQWTYSCTGGGGGSAPTVTYKITYSSGGGTGSAPDSPISYNSGNTFKLPENTYTKSGNNFDGWRDNNTGKIYQPGNVYITTSGDVAFTATWKVKKYTITYNAGLGASGTGPKEPKTFEFGNNFELPECNLECYSNTGFVFNGWSDGSKIYKSGDKYPTSDSNVTLTAQWSVEVAAVVINPATPKIIIKTLNSYTNTPLKFGSVKANSSIIDITSRTYKLNVIHDSGSSIRLVEGVQSALSDKLEIKPSDDGLSITALNGWTGKIIVPVIAIRDSEEVELFIEVTQNPGAVEKPLVNLSNTAKTAISWKQDGSQVTGYVITNGSKIVCKTVNTSCTYNGSGQAKLDLRIKALGNDSTISQAVKPAVTPNNFVVQFDPSSYAIADQYKAVLAKVIRIAKLVGATSFTISGHTDSDGTAALNQVLSQNRANSVEKYLSNSIKNSKFTVTAHAAEISVASNNSNVGKAANRRVEIRIN